MIFKKLTSNVEVLSGILTCLDAFDQCGNKKIPEFFKRVHDIS